MNETDLVLKKETEKWLEKIENVSLKARNEKGEEMIANIKAYIEDCKHFLAQNDFIRSFECVVWAWAFYEIGKDLGFLE
jgi:hypothetical protein